MKRKKNDVFHFQPAPGWVKSGKSCRFFPDGPLAVPIAAAPSRFRPWPPQTAWFDRAHGDASNQPLASRWLRRGRAQSVPRDRNFAHRAHAVTGLHEHHAQARDPRLSLEPFIVAAFNTALVRYNFYRADLTHPGARAGTRQRCTATGGLGTPAAHNFVTEKGPQELISTPVPLEP